MLFDENNKTIKINWKLKSEIIELNVKLHAIHKTTV